MVGFILAILVKQGRLQALYQTLGVPYQDPTPRAWDWYFSQRRQRGVVVTLIDGSKLAGLLDKGSFASSYPAKEDLFLERVYQMEGGIITGKVIPHSGGVWIQGSQIRLIEFYVPLELDEIGEDSEDYYGGYGGERAE